MKFVWCIECCCVCHQGQIWKKADTCLNLYPCVIKYYLILSYLSLSLPLSLSHLPSASSSVSLSLSVLLSLSVSLSLALSVCLSLSQSLSVSLSLSPLKGIREKDLSVSCQSNIYMDVNAKGLVDCISMKPRQTCFCAMASRRQSQSYQRPVGLGQSQSYQYLWSLKSGERGQYGSRPVTIHCVPSVWFVSLSSSRLKRSHLSGLWLWWLASSAYDSSHLFIFRLLNTQLGRKLFCLRPRFIDLFSQS